MRYHVEFELFDTVPASVMGPLKLEIGAQLERIKASGKMKDGGVLLGLRGGYFIFDLESPSELLYLLGNVIWDNCHIHSHPVVSYEELGKYLAETAELKKAA